MKRQKTKIRLVAISIILILAIQGLFAQSGSKAIVGAWQAEKGPVTIKEKGGGFEGKSKLENGEEVVVLKDLRYEEGKWLGEIYAVKRKKYYPVKCKILKDGKLEVKISAGIMSKTFEWTHLKSVND